MKYPTSYSTGRQLALLQTYIAMMDGELMDYEYFNELTGYQKDLYRDTIHALKEMIHDLHLKCSLQRIYEIVETKETKYKKYSYKLLSRFDYSFKMNKELSDEKKILYSSVLIYLQLKKEHYVALEYQANYFPNFTSKTLMHVLEGIKEMVDDEIVKNEILSYEMNVIS